jgi:hypothetical protein
MREGWPFALLPCFGARGTDDPKLSIGPVLNPLSTNESGKQCNKESRGGDGTQPVQYVNEAAELVPAATTPQVSACSIRIS